MDIFTILKEAKNPSPAKKTIRVNIRDSEDYTSDVQDTQSDQEQQIIDTTQDNNYSDYNTEVEKVQPDEDYADQYDDTDQPQDDESNDYTQDVDVDEDGQSEEYDDQANDYTQDVEGDDESQQQYDDQQQPQEQQEELSPEELLEKQQNSELMDRVVDLYYSVYTTVDKLDNVTHSKLISNRITNQVKRNFSRMGDYLYKFILVYSNNTYVKNLYIYNYFIEAYKINIEMLKKINDFN